MCTDCQQLLHISLSYPQVHSWSDDTEHARLQKLTREVSDVMKMWTKDEVSTVMCNNMLQAVMCSNMLQAVICNSMLQPVIHINVKSCNT